MHGYGSCNDPVCDRSYRERVSPPKKNGIWREASVFAEEKTEEFLLGMAIEMRENDNPHISSMNRLVNAGRFFLFFDANNGNAGVMPASSLLD